MSTVSTRIGALEKTIRAEARAQYVQSVEADFSAAISRAAANDGAIKLLKDVKADVIRKGAKSQEDIALEAFLRSAKPSMTADEFFFPRMVKIGADGKELADDTAGHVAVLLPAFGVMFDARKPELAKSHAKAIEMGKSIKLLGHEDWALPELRYLQLTIDRTRITPATNVSFFPETPTNYIYWTQDLYNPKASPVSGIACYVSFYGGGVGWGFTGDSGFVRARRFVSPRQ